MKPILGKILVAKDRLFFCPHINAKISTLRVFLYSISVICEATSVQSRVGLKISSGAGGKVQ